MFKDNKYKTWYLSLMTKSNNRNLSSEIYTESHHIIPRSLGGTNEDSNLVVLTAREHFIAHLLLSKFTTGQAVYKMNKAVKMMTCNIVLRDKSIISRYNPPSKIYEILRKLSNGEHSKETRKLISENLKGWTSRKNPEELIAMKIKQSKAHLGKKLTEITKLKMGQAKIGKARNPEIGKKIGISQTGKYVSNEICLKIKNSLKYQWTLKNPEGLILISDDLLQFCDDNSVVYSSLIKTLVSGMPLEKGRSKGWQVIGRTK